MHLEKCEVSVIETEDSAALKLPLREFLECSTVSHSAKIVKGSNPEFDLQEAFDIPCGTSLVFHRRLSPEVCVEYEDTVSEASARNWIRLSLSVDFPARFCLLPYDPVSGDTSVDHIYHTVQDLVHSFPVYAQANTTYGDKFSDPKSSFNCGDRLKLIRLVIREGVKFMECKLLGEPQLLQLPMTYVGEFTTLPDDTAYLLGDIVSLPPRRRRVCLTDITQKVAQIPGLPENYTGELYVTEPNSVIEASPVRDHSLIIGIPADLDMMVAPDKPGDAGGEMLASFAANNRSILPVVARVSDWDEATTILENHYIKPGVEIVVHGWTRQSKVLAIAGDSHFAIPLTYTGKFRIKPKQYQGVTELERAYPGNKLRVIKVDRSDTTFPLALRDVIRIKREETLKRKTFTEVEIRCERYEAGGRLREFKLPLASAAVFEEQLEDAGHSYTIKELVSIVSDQEVMVEVAETSHDYKSLGSNLPSGCGILLCDFVIEPAVYVSVESPEAPAFHIPLRTGLRVQLLYQLERSTSPLLTRNNPRLSTLDRCVEVVSLHLFQSLRPQRALGTSHSPARTLGTPSRSAGQSMAPTWTENGWPSSITVDRDVLSGKSNVRKSHKPPSVAGSDVAGGTSKKTNGVNKLKSKFRRHKSQENLVTNGSIGSTTGDFAPLSLPSRDVEYTQSLTNANVILAERSVSTRHAPLHVSTVDTNGDIESHTSPGSTSSSSDLPCHTVNVLSQSPQKRGQHLNTHSIQKAGAHHVTSKRTAQIAGVVKSDTSRAKGEKPLKSTQDSTKGKSEQPIVISAEVRVVRNKQSNGVSATNNNLSLDKSRAKGNAQQTAADSASKAVTKPTPARSAEPQPAMVTPGRAAEVAMVTPGRAAEVAMVTPGRAAEPAMVTPDGRAQHISSTRSKLSPPAATPVPSTLRQDGHPPHLSSRRSGPSPHPKDLNGSTSPSTMEIPPGYALVAMPTAGQNAQAVTGGYVLVPVTSPGHHPLSNVPSEGEDEGNYEDSGPFDMSFSKTKSNLTIPPDGNLYHLSVKKFGEFLRLLRIDEAVVRNCIKQKIDGKKFSRLGNSDLQKLGAIHPIVMYFRRLTGKTKHKFML